MAGQPKILVFAGSARAGSLNRGLAQQEARTRGGAGGARCRRRCDAHRPRRLPAHEAFGEGGALVDPRQQATLAGIARRLVDVTARLAS